jgi:hypothetical protein
MAVYYGVVRNNVVILPDDVRLPDGAPVEVRPRVVNERDDSVIVDEELRAAGLLEDMPAESTPDATPFEPVSYTGRPLSEQIIEERR